MDLFSQTYRVSDKAEHMGDVSPETPCSFSRQASDQEDFVLSGVTSGSALGVEEDVAVELLETTASNDALKLWPWVNQVRAFLILGLFSDQGSLRHLSPCLHGYPSRS